MRVGASAWRLGAGFLLGERETLLFVVAPQTATIVELIDGMQTERT